MASTEQEHIELAGIANEMAERIAEGHEWQALKRLHTVTGNGETDAWDLPADYDRMPEGQQLWTSRISGPLKHIRDQDDWLGMQVRDLNNVPTGAWTMLGAQIVFNPILTSGETVQFYYLSNKIVTDEDGETKTAFTSDSDVFRLDERLLRMGIIWRWKQLKGLPFEVPAMEYQVLLEQRIMRDAAKGIIRGGRFRPMAKLAYPWALGQ